MKMDIGKNIGEINEKPKETLNNIDFDPDKRVERAKEFVGEQTNEIFNPDTRVSDIKEVLENYTKDLKERVEYPELLQDINIDLKKLDILDSSKVSELREEFSKNRTDLRNEWEKITGKEWPKYTTDVYDKNGNMIRKKGDCFDAHHIKPLFLGGKNEVSNIVPIHALEHYDHTGVHDHNAPLSILKNTLKGD